MHAVDLNGHTRHTTRHQYTFERVTSEGRPPHDPPRTRRTKAGILAGPQSGTPFRSGTIFLAAARSTMLRAFAYGAAAVMLWKVRWTRRLGGRGVRRGGKGRGRLTDPGSRRRCARRASCPTPRTSSRPFPVRKGFCRGRGCCAAALTRWARADGWRRHSARPARRRHGLGPLLRQRGRPLAVQAALEVRAAIRSRPGVHLPRAGRAQRAVRAAGVAAGGARVRGPRDGPPGSVRVSVCVHTHLSDLIPSLRPGHGQSEGTRTYSRAFSHLTRDFIHFVRSVPCPDTTPRILIGHSMGGLIAARVAQLEQGLFTAVALSAPGTRVWRASDRPAHKRAHTHARSAQARSGGCVPSVDASRSYAVRVAAEGVCVNVCVCVRSVGVGRSERAPRTHARTLTRLPAHARTHAQLRLSGIDARTVSRSPEVQLSYTIDNLCWHGEHPAVLARAGGGRGAVRVLTRFCAGGMCVRLAMCLLKGMEATMRGVCVCVCACVYVCVCVCVCVCACVCARACMPRSPTHPFCPRTHRTHDGFVSTGAGELQVPLLLQHGTSDTLTAIEGSRWVACRRGVCVC